jgi:hypothetical protein
MFRKAKVKYFFISKKNRKNQQKSFLARLGVYLRELGFTSRPFFAPMTNPVLGRMLPVFNNATASKISFPS